MTVSDPQMGSLAHFLSRQLRPLASTSCLVCGLAVVGPGVCGLGCGTPQEPGPGLRPCGCRGGHHGGVMAPSGCLWGWGPRFGKQRPKQSGTWGLWGGGGPRGRDGVKGSRAGALGTGWPERPQSDLRVTQERRPHGPAGHRP